MSQSASTSELLKVLAELSETFPDWRLGQTIANLATAAGQMDESGVWDLEDAEALASARRLIKQHKTEADAGG